jgi:hypothetical protein
VTSNSARCLFAWLLAAVLVFRGGNAIRESFQTRNWQPIHALVTESDARWVEHRLPVRRSMWSYELHLRFVYTIKRRVFTGARASFSAWGPNENLNPFNSAIAHRFPEGTQVIAHYDPLDPSRSVLQPAARPSAWLALALGLLAARLRSEKTRLLQEENGGTLWLMNRWLGSWRRLETSRRSILLVTRRQ